MDLSFLDNIAPEDDLYDIVGADETSTIEQLRKEFKQRAKILHPDKVRENDDSRSQEEFERLRWAYQILSNKESREKYDVWRRCGLAIPFKEWLKFNYASRTSIHWALKPKKKLMLTETEEIQNGSKIDSSKIQPNQEPTDNQKNKETRLDSRSKIDNAVSIGSHTTKKKVPKRLIKTWGCSGIRSKFRRYEI